MGMFSATPAASEHCLDKQLTLKSLNGAAPPNSLNRGAKVRKSFHFSLINSQFLVVRDVFLEHSTCVYVVIA